MCRLVPDKTLLSLEEEETKQDQTVWCLAVLPGLSKGGGNVLAQHCCILEEASRIPGGLLRDAEYENQ